MKPVSTKVEEVMKLAKTIRAIFRNGVIEPLEKVDLEEGKEITVTIGEPTGATSEEAFLRAAGSWKGLIDVDEFLKNIYEDRLMSTRPEVKL